MNCNQTLPALVAGNPLRRLLARRHAARCPRCRETLAFHDEVATTFADHPPLTAAQRAAWMSAADRPPASPASPRRSASRKLAWAGALATAAAAVTLAFFIARGLAPPAEERPVVIAPREQPALAQPLAPEPPLPLDAMRAELDGIEQELALLARKAELLDSRAEAEVLWAQYAPAEESRTL